MWATLSATVEVSSGKASRAGAGIYLLQSHLSAGEGEKLTPELHMFSNRTLFLAPRQRLQPQALSGNPFRWITLQVCLPVPGLSLPWLWCVSPGAGTHLCILGSRHGPCAPSPECYKPCLCLWCVAQLCSRVYVPADPQRTRPGGRLHGKCCRSTNRSLLPCSLESNTALCNPPPASEQGGMSHGQGRFQTCHNNR